MNLGRRLQEVLAKLLCTATVAAAILPGPMAMAQGWKLGAEFEDQLRTPVGFVWQSNPIRQALNKLSRNQRVAIFVDRRVPTDILAAFSAERLPLNTALRKAANKFDFDTGYVNSVVYFGPQGIVEKIETVAAVQREEMKNYSANSRRRWASPTALRWEMLETPRAIIARAAKTANVEITNLDLVPHDLWAAGELPKLPLCDQLTILLAGFDLTYRTDNQQRKIVLFPIPAELKLTRRFVVSKNPLAVAKQIREQFRDVELTRSGNQLRVVGGFADHYQIARLIENSQTKTPAPTAPGARQVYTLTIKNQPVGGVIKALARKWKLQARIAADAEEQLEKLVSFEVSDASREELLKAALTPAQLSFRLSSEALEVFADP